MRNSLLMTAAAAMLFSTSASAITCVCNTINLERLISTQTNPTLKAINASVNAVGAKVDLHGSNIQSAVNAVRVTAEKSIAQNVTLSDYQVNEARNTAAQQAAVLGDMESARQTRGSKHTNACGMANASERVGKGTVTGSYTSSAMMGKRRQDANAVLNPAQAVAVINKLQDRDRMPEFAASDAGTMSEADRGSYMNFLKVLMPTPPRSPRSLPTQFKSTDKAREYEAEFKKWEAGSMLFDKIFMRDGVMASPTIEVTSEQIALWDQITGAAKLPNKLIRTADGQPSAFPDQWGTLAPTTISGRKFISERDFIRSEVFRRYGNPFYQSDKNYGLASFATTEALLKEQIMMQALTNRMLYEIMNSMLHEKSLSAVEAAWRNDETYKGKLRELERDMQRN